MTVKEFLLHHTKTNELVVIQEDGWNRQAVWVDSEDIFTYNPRFVDVEIKREYWGKLPIIDAKGTRVEIPCHYIDT